MTAVVFICFTFQFLGITGIVTFDRFIAFIIGLHFDSESLEFKQ